MDNRAAGDWSLVQSAPRSTGPDQLSGGCPGRTGQTQRARRSLEASRIAAARGEVVSDGFKAHADKDHIHHLAPERLAPVMELLKRLNTVSGSNS